MHIFISFIANYALVVSIAGLLITWFSFKDRAKRADFVFQALVGGALVLLLAKVGSLLFYNPRPFVVGHFIPYFPHPNNNGFPSDHTLFTSFSGFLVIAYKRKLGLVLLAIAACIGAARVIAGVHHFVDIVGAFAISGVTMLVMQALLKLTRRKAAL